MLNLVKVDTMELFNPIYLHADGSTECDRNSSPCMCPLSSLASLTSVYSDWPRSCSSDSQNSKNGRVALTMLSMDSCVCNKPHIYIMWSDWFSSRFSGEEPEYKASISRDINHWSIEMSANK